MREKFDGKVRDKGTKWPASAQKSGARFVELFLSVGY